MNDFERTMLREGVVRTNAIPEAPKPKVSEPSAPVPFQGPSEAQTANNNGDRAGEGQDNSLYAWAPHGEAKEVLRSALRKLKEEGRNGKKGWISMTRQNGTNFLVKADSEIGRITLLADKENIRIIIIGGNGWTCVMHPMMGVATIEMDPDQVETKKIKYKRR